MDNKLPIHCCTDQRKMCGCRQGRETTHAVILKPKQI